MPTLVFYLRYIDTIIKGMQDISLPHASLETPLSGPPHHTMNPPPGYSNHSCHGSSFKETYDEWDEHGGRGSPAHDAFSFEHNPNPNTRSVSVESMPSPRFNDSCKKKKKQKNSSTAIHLNVEASPFEVKRQPHPTYPPHYAHYPIPPPSHYMQMQPYQIVYVPIPSYPQLYQPHANPAYIVQGAPMPLHRGVPPPPGVIGVTGMGMSGCVPQYYGYQMAPPPPPAPPGF